MKTCSDYRGLKKRITAIRRWQEGLDPLTSSSADEGDADNEGDAPKPPSNAGKSEGLPTTVPIPQDDNAIAGPSSLAGGADDVSLDEDEDVYQEGLDENKLRRPDLRHKSTSKRGEPETSFIYFCIDDPRSTHTPEPCAVPSVCNYSFN